MTGAPRILFLISDTGGGHREAANAITAALREISPAAVAETKDALVLAGGWPTNKSPQIYAWGMKHAQWVWGLFFHLSNGPRRAALMADLGYPSLKRRLIALIRDFRPDVVVSTHPLLTRSVSRALRDGGLTIPFMVVVTDLVTGHATWYEPTATRTCLPTQEALESAARCGVARERMIVTGQPVHPRALTATRERDVLRARFQWNEPVVLLVGGGDGVGNLGARVRALAEARVAARLVVICGRNERLRQELTARAWPIQVDVRGFVDNLHELMAAADILVTKGGPGSVIEGCLAGLPILIYDYLPGQEVGNVALIKENEAGAYVPSPAGLPAAVRRYLDDPVARAAASARARALAIPDSAQRIAREILALTGATSAVRPGVPAPG